MSTHDIGFYEDLTKIIFELSSNTHLISSADSNDIGFAWPSTQWHQSLPYAFDC